ncbi:TetR/AcrR family transcriptional regulator [Saccharopolyspora cebuensis]
MFRVPSCEDGPVDHTTRRDRLREQLTQDIKRSARRIMVEHGPPGLTLSSIARAVAVTPPALYRYYDDLDDIVANLATDLVTELVEKMSAAIDAEPPNDLAARLRAATCTFRQWSVEHPVEYGLLFGAPNAPAGKVPAAFSSDWVVRLADVWGPLVAEAWRRNGFPVPDEDAIDPELLEQLGKYGEVTGQSGLPAGVLVVFLDCWRQVYGAVCLEVFGHMGPAITDHEPLFRTMVDDLLARLGFTQS